MDFDIVGYLIFASVTAITPGPNNFLLFASGKKGGTKGSYKLMLGIFCGFSALLYTSGYGIAGIITGNPTIHLVLKIISSIWLGYLAIKLRDVSVKTDISDTPFEFHHGFLMQFVNPKAWIMAIGGAAAFLPRFQTIHLSVITFASIFSSIGIICMFLWVYFGSLFSKLLRSQRSNTILGNALSLLMLSSIVFIWLK